MIFILNLFKKNSKLDTFFLSINRYYKDTVGYPIELHNYPFDKNWNVIISETSWNQKHIHFLFFKRILMKEGNINDELEKIKRLQNKRLKKTLE